MIGRRSGMVSASDLRARLKTCWVSFKVSLMRFCRSSSKFGLDGDELVVVVVDGMAEQ